MKRYLITEAKTGETMGGMACGPVAGHGITAVRADDGTGAEWYSMAEAEGYIYLFKTEEDIYGTMLREEEDEAFLAFRNAHRVWELDGIAVHGEIGEVLESITAHPDSPAAPLIRYMLALTWWGTEDREGLLKLSSGRYADEMDLGETDLEREYREEREEEELADEDAVNGDGSF